MPRATVSDLTVARVNKVVREVGEGARAPGYVRVGGLCLQVKRRGDAGATASRVSRRTIHGARRDVGLGGWPDVTLAQARERARGVMDEVWRGGDPVAARRAARAALTEALAAVPTSEAATRGYLKDTTSPIKHARDRRAIESRPRTYVVPHIGATRMDQVTTADVLEMLRQEVEAPSGAKGGFWPRCPTPRCPPSWRRSAPGARAPRRRLS